MKILLINPPSLDKTLYVKEGRCQSKATEELWPPITLGIMAALLKNNGFDIVLRDCVALNYSKQEVHELIKNGFDAAIVNSTTPTIYDDLEIAKVIKSNNVKTAVIFYGTHVTALPEEALSYDCVDYVVRREPEMSVLDLLLTLKNNKSLSEVRGISFKRNKKIVHNPDREFLDDIDSLPFVPRELFPNDKYISPTTGEPIALIRISRGCPYQCTYCTSKLYYGQKWRTRSPENILDEIEECVNKHGIKNFHFQSDTFNFNKQMVLDFCKGIHERNLNIRWMCNSRVNLVDEEMLTAMKNAGCWLISFGTESGSQELLDAIKKGATLSQAENAFKLMRKIGIKSIAYFMFSLPGETKETINQSMKFSKKLNPDYVKFMKIVPYPGTEFYELAEKKGWIKSKDWSRYDMTNNDFYEMGVMSNKELTKQIRKAYLSFYLRPTFILAQIKNKSLSEIWVTAKSGIKFLKMAIER